MYGERSALFVDTSAWQVGCGYQDYNSSEEGEEEFESIEYCQELQLVYVVTCIQG